jgi:hypothetical protein
MLRVTVVLIQWSGLPPGSRGVKIVDGEIFEPKQHFLVSRNNNLDRVIRFTMVTVRRDGFQGFAVGVHSFKVYNGFNSFLF